MTHSKRQPKIEWDHLDVAEFGGFHVISGLEYFNPPADWVVDPDDPTHFLPRFKPCKYRRMSRGTIKGRPYAQINCLLFEDVVDHLTCVDCEQCVPPPVTTTYREIVDLPPDTPDVEVVEAFNKMLREDNPNGLTPADLALIPQDNYDTVFSANQPPSEYISKGGEEGGKKEATPWPDCKYHQQVEPGPNDCGSCTKHICGCELCPLVNLVVTKKDCKKCKHRQTT